MAIPNMNTACPSSCQLKNENIAFLKQEVCFILKVM